MYLLMLYYLRKGFYVLQFIMKTVHLGPYNLNSHNKMLDLSPSFFLFTWIFQTKLISELCIVNVWRQVFTNQITYTALIIGTTKLCSTYVDHLEIAKDATRCN